LRRLVLVLVLLEATLCFLVAQECLEPVDLLGYRLA